LWWVLLAFGAVLAGWAAMAWQAREPAAARVAVRPGPNGVVEEDVVVLPLATRLKSWFTPSRTKVKGPGLFHRMRYRWLSSETAYSLKARREARRVQRRIKDRRR